MKQFRTLLAICLLILTFPSRAQFVLNEMYCMPGAGKEEFFELYNTGADTSAISMNGYTLVTYFDMPGQRGFYALDLPNIFVNPKSYVVGSSSIPFDYQGVTGSTASQFSWNDSALTQQEGYLKKWVLGTADLSDGNPYYDLAPIPSGFNDLFNRRTGTSASYSVFLYKNGVLVNAFIGGTGGMNTMPSFILSMPDLNIDMSGASADFIIKFSTYSNVSCEYVGQDAGNDNGYIRERDGLCGAWNKSSAQVQHTPGLTNGTSVGSTGTLLLDVYIHKGMYTGDSSYVYYNIISGPVDAFPVELQVYLDNGTVNGELDAYDKVIAVKVENQVSDGPFLTSFLPQNEDVIIAARSRAGCYDKVTYIPSAATLPIKLTRFDGRLENNKITLNWTVSENSNLKKFEIERSENGIEYIKAGEVSGTENTGTQAYSFQDYATKSNTVMYRLKMIDQAGEFTYSKILKLERISKNSQLAVLNNPFTEQLSFRYNSNLNQQIQFRLFDQTGRLRFTQDARSYIGTNLYNIPINSTFEKGIYILEVRTGCNERTTSKLIRN